MRAPSSRICCAWARSWGEVDDEGARAPAWRRATFNFVRSCAEVVWLLCARLLCSWAMREERSEEVGEGILALQVEKNVRSGRFECLACDHAEILLPKDKQSNR